MAFYSHELLSSPLFKSFWRASVGPIGAAGGEHARAVMSLRRLKRTEALEAAHLITQGVEALQRLLDGKENLQQLLEDLAAGDTGRRTRHALGQRLTDAAAEGHVPVMLTLVVPAQLLVGIVRVHHTQGMYLKQDCERALIYISSSTHPSAATGIEVDADAEAEDATPAKKAGRGAKRALASLLLPEQPGSKRKHVDITLPDEDEMYGAPINLRVPALHGADSLSAGLRMSRSLLALTPSGQEQDAVTILRTSLAGGPALSFAGTTGLGHTVSGQEDSGRAGAGLLGRRLASLPAEDELFEPVPDLLLLEPQEAVEEVLRQHDTTFEESDELLTPVGDGVPPAHAATPAAPARPEGARRLQFDEHAGGMGIEADVGDEAAAISELDHAGYKDRAAATHSTGTTQVYGHDAAERSPEGVSKLARTERAESADHAAEAQEQPAAQSVHVLLPPKKLHKSQIDEQATVLPSHTIREALDDTSDVVRGPLLARVHAAVQATSAPAAPSIVRALTKRGGGQSARAAVRSVASQLSALLPAAAHDGLLGQQVDCQQEAVRISLDELVGLSGLAEVHASKTPQGKAERRRYALPSLHPQLPRPAFALAPELSAIIGQQLQLDVQVPLESGKEAGVKGAATPRKRAKRAETEAAQDLEPAAEQPTGATKATATEAPDRATLPGELEPQGSQEWLTAAEADMIEMPGDAPDADDMQREMFEEEEREAGPGDMQALDFHMLAPQGPEQEAGRLPSAVSGSIPQLLASTQPLSAPDLSMLVESSGGSEASVVAVLTERPLQVAAVYKEALQSSSKRSVPMAQFTTGNTRMAAARWFVDSLVLMNAGLMTLQQDKAFGDIEVSMRAATTA